MFYFKQLHHCSLWFDYTKYNLTIFAWHTNFYIYTVVTRTVCPPVKVTGTAVCLYTCRLCLFLSDSFNTWWRHQVSPVNLMPFSSPGFFFFKIMLRKRQHVRSESPLRPNFQDISNKAMGVWRTERSSWAQEDEVKLTHTVQTEVNIRPVGAELSYIRSRGVPVRHKVWPLLFYNKARIDSTSRFRVGSSR